MDIGLLDDNKIEIGMKGYIQEAINVFDEEMSTKVSYPENKNLHKVNKYSHKPPTKQTEDLHSILENILWTTKQAQTDIETVVAFICSRVKPPK